MYSFNLIKAVDMHGYVHDQWILFEHFENSRVHTVIASKIAYFTDNNIVICMTTFTVDQISNVILMVIHVLHLYNENTV